MGTEHLTAPTSLCDLFHESELCPDEILTILQSLEDSNNNNIFNVAAAAAAATAATPGPLMENKIITNNKNKKRKKPAKTVSSSSPRFGSDEESDEGHAVFSQRKSVRRHKASPPASSMEDVSGEDGGGAAGSNSNGKMVSHIAVERNRRKQMNEHLAVLRQLMPCFYVKKGDQASIIGGVIDYINELQQVLQSLEAKKQRKIYTNEVGLSPRVASSPRLIPQPHSNLSLSPRKPPPSPRPLINLPISPRTPQSTSPYNKPPRQPLIQPSSIASPTSNSNSCSSVAYMIMMMNSYNNSNSNGVANELVASSKSSVADVEVKFCGPNLELKTLSSKIAGQTLKIVSAIEDLALDILQVSINTAEETMLNSFTIKIGIECQLSAEELAQQIQETFC
uniref:BHLH domain-containing protein n=1 Tax=Kalanchoe fedtschenkoi TaxID=63787 RepID=A0A7N1A018_KALFE